MPRPLDIGAGDLDCGSDALEVGGRLASRLDGGDGVAQLDLRSGLEVHVLAQLLEGSAAVIGLMVAFSLSIHRMMEC